MESTHQQPAFWEQRAADARARAAEWRQIRALVIRLGVALVDADDVAQEVALCLHRTTAEVDRRALVWVTSRGKAKDHRDRRDFQRRAHASAARELRDFTAPPHGEAAVMERERIVILLRAIDALEALEPALHEVVRMLLEGRTLPEIAEAQGTPYGTAVSRTHRARVVLRETLQRWTAEDEGRALRAALRGAERWH